jgi:hypothetical protein
VQFRAGNQLVFCVVQFTGQALGELCHLIPRGLFNDERVVAKSRYIPDLLIPFVVFKGGRPPQTHRFLWGQGIACFQWRDNHGPIEAIITPV